RRSKRRARGPITFLPSCALTGEGAAATPTSPASRVHAPRLVSPDWLIAAVIIAGASFVLGLAGFGNGLVAMALLPFVMSPVTAIVVLTIYTIVLVLIILLPDWRHLEPSRVLDMLAGTLVGTPVGVWVLRAFPVSTLKRLIGAALVAVVL